MSNIPPDPPRASPAPPDPGALEAGRRQLRALVTALLTPAPSAQPLLADARSRWVRRLPYAVALSLTIILIPTTAQVLSHDYGLSGALAGGLAVAQSAPLLLAVVRPLPAWWIIVCADTAGALVLLTVPLPPGRDWPWPPMAIVGYVALCLALALRESRRTLVSVWLVTAVVSLGLGFLAPERSDGANVLLVIVSGIVLLLGAVVRERADAQQRLAEQETISEAERSRRTLLEERARIARELHDVVAHHMSVITVQADSAPYRLPELPEAAREEFGSIATTARASLSEMRRLLGVLRSAETGGDLAPQPGLDRLGGLVEATVRAGVPTELSVDVPEGRELPRAVTLSAYRVVQEALANVVRHAPGARTRVTVDGQGPLLRVLVVNGPPSGPAGAPVETSGTGHGLVGMRERVRLVGGELEIESLPGGGFRVAARLPVAEPDAERGPDVPRGVADPAPGPDVPKDPSGTAEHPARQGRFRRGKGRAARSGEARPRHGTGGATPPTTADDTEHDGGPGSG
ncbi:sensor histidine kinase [Streptomyces sp. AJS327]|uniref:sensor histidine kinase n=1 Tax=Streptomyces sp. AJS327 TaxID=2545265 RepID=UPI0015DEECE8|nr:sensor histidine kinase [Streptomyces sp. AJS327]MBA0049995.1 sensor histidine kinase [Streptomyces sp. AJS327]